MDLEAYFDALASVPNQRSAEFADIEIKDGGNVFLFDGLSTPYNHVTDLGDFTEEVLPGAFRSAIDSGQNVPMLHEHHPHQLLATTKSGRLKLIDDARGLRAKAKLVKTDLSSRVKALADSGDITGMSTGWVVGDRRNHNFNLRGAKPHRTINNFKRILDVSTTWNPAYQGSEAQFRSLAMQYADSPDVLQRILMGAYPQLVDLGDTSTDGTGEEPAETRDAGEHVEAHPRVEDADAALRRLETAKRRMSFITLTTGGLDDAS